MQYNATAFVKIIMITFLNPFREGKQQTTAFKMMICSKTEHYNLHEDRLIYCFTLEHFENDIALNPVFLKKNILPNDYVHRLEKQTHFIVLTLHILLLISSSVARGRKEPRDKWKSEAGVTAGRDREAGLASL